MLIGFKTSRGFLGLPWTSEEARKTGGGRRRGREGRRCVRDQALARGRKRRRRDGELWGFCATAEFSKPSSAVAPGIPSSSPSSPSIPGGHGSPISPSSPTCHSSHRSPHGIRVVLVVALI